MKYFKSEENIVALKKLLNDPATSLDVKRHGDRVIEMHKTYPVREAAFATLKALGVEVRQPVLKEKVSEGMETGAHQQWQ